MSFANIDPTIGQAVLVMDLDGYGQGWGEKLYLPSTSYSDALNVAAPLLTARLKILPNTCEMNFAHVTWLGKPRDSAQADPSFPKTGLWPGVGSTSTPPAPPAYPPDSVEVNDITNAIRYRCETDKGQWCMRWIHGVPDAEIRGNKLTGTYTPYTTGNPVPDITDPNTTTWLDLVAYYLWLIQTTTQMYRLNPGGSPQTPQSSSIKNVFLRGAGHHKVGRPFDQERGRAIPR